jgi:hypothetical protein
MPTGQPGVDQDGRRSGPAFHITQSLATGDVVILPIAAMAPSLTGAATSIMPSASLSRRSITAPPLNPQAIAEVHRILKVTAKKRLINGKRINARAKERGAQKTPVKSQLLRGGDGDVREILGA